MLLKNKAIAIAGDCPSVRQESLANRELLQFEKEIATMLRFFLTTIKNIPTI
jgi:hypothetical protein